MRCSRTLVSVDSGVSGGGNQVPNLVLWPAQPPCLGNGCPKNGRLSRTEDLGDFRRFLFRLFLPLAPTSLTRPPVGLVLG